MILARSKNSVPWVSHRKSVRPPQCVFLRDARDRKRLARKTRDDHVVGRHRGRIAGELPDIAGNAGFRLAEVRSVSLAAELVPFRGEHTRSARGLEREPQPANSGEQIDEPEQRRYGGRSSLPVQMLLKPSGRDRRRPGLSALVPEYGAHAHAEHVGGLPVRKAGPLPELFELGSARRSSHQNPPRTIR